MKKYYVIQDTLSNKGHLYWYGYFSHKYWTDKIEEAKFYDSEVEAEWQLAEPYFKGGIYQIMPVYK